MKKLSVSVYAILLMFFILSTIAGAAYSWPERQKPGGGCYRVAEPMAIVLLGAGLVSLGVYAKKKRGKKK